MKLFLQQPELLVVVFPVFTDMRDFFEDGGKMMDDELAGELAQEPHQAVHEVQPMLYQHEHQDQDVQ